MKRIALPRVPQSSDFRSSLEILEQRIAPAAVTNLTFVNDGSGNLTIPIGNTNGNISSNIPDFSIVITAVGGGFLAPVEPLIPSPNPFGSLSGSLLGGTANVRTVNLASIFGDTGPDFLDLVRSGISQFESLGLSSSGFSGATSSVARSVGDVVNPDDVLNDTAVRTDARSTGLVDTSVIVPV